MHATRGKTVKMTLKNFPLLNVRFSNRFHTYPFERKTPKKGNFQAK